MLRHREHRQVEGHPVQAVAESAATDRWPGRPLALQHGPDRGQGGHLDRADDLAAILRAQLIGPSADLLDGMAKLLLRQPDGLVASPGAGGEAARGADRDCGRTPRRSGPCRHQCIERDGEVGRLAIDIQREALLQGLEQPPEARLHAFLLVVQGDVDSREGCRLRRPRRRLTKKLGDRVLALLRDEARRSQGCFDCRAA
mmetsp:Transcript_106033/g.304890  ORF Transcript_106033/g.304890 Transcript_106033/m.304890 type:complete len:200 (+) Transcript_106033:1140-1739(+)